MSEIKEKTKEKYSYKTSEIGRDITTKILTLELARLNSNNKKDRCLTIKIASTRGCCGSMEIFDGAFAGIDNQIRNIFPKKEREKLLEHIFEDDDVYMELTVRNHIYFLDMASGILENIFGDLDFKIINTYLNRNSENTVNMWSMNRWTEEEVQNMIENDYDDDDY